jgi:hypothetical protein
MSDGWDNPFPPEWAKSARDYGREREAGERNSSHFNNTLNGFAERQGSAMSSPSIVPDTPAIIAVPYQWPDPATIPPRQFLFGRHYIRRYMSGTIGGGGRSKTTLGIAEAIFMTAGRNPLTGESFEPLRVWALNGEEIQDELDRRTAAVGQYYGIGQAECGDRLFMQSVRDKPPRFATLLRGNIPALNLQALLQFESEVREKRIDVFMLDPLISFHAVNENSNADMDLLIKEGLGGVASRTNTAGDISHHPGKPKPGQAETTVDDARGASAFLWAVRSARVLNFMSPEEANKLGVSDDERRLHIRVTNGKANMGPIGKANWFKLEPQNLPNGDEVVCVSPWKPPHPFQGVTTADMHKCRTLSQTSAYRADSRSKEWFGYAVADVLNINIRHGAENDPKDIARVKQIIAGWLKNKVLNTEERTGADRHKHEYVIPGPWKDETKSADPSDAEVPE